MAGSSVARKTSKPACRSHSRDPFPSSSRTNSQLKIRQPQLHQLHSKSSSRISACPATLALDFRSAASLKRLRCLFVCYRPRCSCAEVLVLWFLLSPPSPATWWNFPGWIPARLVDSSKREEAIQLLRGGGKQRSSSLR